MALWLIPILGALLIFPIGRAYGDPRMEHRAVLFKCSKQAEAIGLRRAQVVFDALNTRAV